MYVDAYPDFQLKDFPVLLELMSLQGGKWVETYNPQRGRWVCHDIETIREVETQTPLLYRVLPAGVNGARLAEHDCPGLKQEIERQINPGDSRDGTRSRSKRRPERDDSEDEVRPTKRP